MSSSNPIQSALDVAKYLLSLVDEEKGQIISNLALQKLLYYCQGYYLALTGEKLFSEDIVAWQYGPVVQEVYEAYKDYHNQPLPTNELSTEILQKFTDTQTDLMGSVFEHYKDYSAIGLMNQTHSEMPWKSTQLRQVISIEKLQNFFQDKIIR